MPGSERLRHEITRVPVIDRPSSDHRDEVTDTLL
jgi:hypothetical protein